MNAAIHPPSRSNPLLLRFIVDGLRQSIDSHLTGGLPLHRLAWELRVRWGCLAPHLELHTVNRLHQLACIIEQLHRRTAHPPRDLDPDDGDLLVTTLAAFRVTLDGLARPPGPTPSSARPCVA